MKIVKNKHHKIVIIVIILLVSIVAAAVIFYFDRSQKPTDQQPTTTSGSKTNKLNDVNLSPPTNAEVTEGKNIKSNSVGSSDSGQSNSSLVVSLQAIQKGNQVTFDTLIQSVSNDGTCVLSITSGNQTIEKTAGTFANPNSSSCKGFSVLASELPSGTWNATLTVTIGTSSGVGKYNIQVTS